MKTYNIITITNHSHQIDALDILEAINKYIKLSGKPASNIKSINTVLTF